MQCGVDVCSGWSNPDFLLEGTHVRFRRVQTLVREGSPLVKLRFIGRRAGAPCWAPSQLGDRRRWQ